MAYTPTEWVTGDIITAEKLNKAEEGIADSSPLMVSITLSGTTYTMSETYKTIADALDEGKRVVFTLSGHSGKTLFQAGFYGTDRMGGLIISLIVIEGASVATQTFSAVTEDDYPVYGSEV